MNRSEHLAWCKRRAIAYLPNCPQEALTSMFSDLGKNPETEGHIAIELGTMLMLTGDLTHPDDVRRFIEGFN